MPEELKNLAEKTAHGSFFLLFGSVVSQVALGIGSILIARFLGPEGYGKYSLALSVPILLASLSDLGINQALIRFPAKFRAEGNEKATTRILKSAIMFRLLTSLALTAVCFIFSDFFAKVFLNRAEMGRFVRICSLFIFFQGILSSTSLSFIGLDRMDKNALLQGVMAIVKASVGPLLIVLGLGIMGAILGHIVGYAVAGIIALILLYLGPYRSLEFTSYPEGHSFVNDFQLLLKYGLPLYVITALSIVIERYKLFLLAYFVDDVGIGNFQGAITLRSLLPMVISPITTALFPAFSKFNPDTEKAELQRFFTLSVRYVSFIILPATIGVMLLSEEIVQMTFGAGYELTPLFLILSSSVFLFTGMGHSILGRFFMGIGTTKVDLHSYLLNILFFVPLSFYFTLWYTIAGLLVASLVANFASLVYKLWLADHRFSITLDYKTQFRIYLTAFLSALPVLLFLQLSFFTAFLNVLLSGCLFGFTYLTLSPFLGSIQSRDLENLRFLFRGNKVIWLFMKGIFTYESILLSTKTELLHNSQLTKEHSSNQGRISSEDPS